MGGRAIVLLSGGLDSATTAAVALSRGFSVHALSFRYGQKAHREVEAAAAVARSLGLIQHQILDIALDRIGGSSLTTSEPVPLGEPQSGRIPSTYVPARNTIFLSYALALAETVNAFDLFIGANSRDYSGYPDCRPEFFKAFERMARLGTRLGAQGGTLRVHAPLQNMSKAEIIKKGASLGVDFSLTVSCYQPDEEGLACGRCESCRIRLHGFRDAGIADPVRYCSAQQKDRKHG